MGDRNPYAPKPHSRNPYQHETSQNTGINWNTDEQPLDVTPSDLQDFSKDMQVMQLNIFRHLEGFRDMGTEATRATGVGGFPEGRHLAALLDTCVAEFSQFTSYAGTGAQNCGFAANTVADCYSGTDAMNTTGLNAVNAVKFAFGDSSVPVPERWAEYQRAGLSIKTWAQAMFEQNNTDPSAAMAAYSMDPGAWQEGTRKTEADGSVTTTFTGPNGQQLTMNVRKRGGRTITTTTVGNVTSVETSTTTQLPAGPDHPQGGRQTTVDTTDGHGHELSQRTTTNENLPGGGTRSTTTTRYYDDHGNVNRTTVSTDTHNGDGSETTTDRTLDGNGKEVSGDSGATGAQPPLLTGAQTQDPGLQAIRSLSR